MIDWDYVTVILRVLIVCSGFILFCQCVYRGAYPTASRALKHRVIGMGIISMGATGATVQHINDPFVLGLPFLLLGLIWSNYGMMLTNMGDKENRPGYKGLNM